MKTIALRFSDQFAPEVGTIQAHQLIIDQCGSVWYGKMGTRISEKAKGLIMSNEHPRILLIHSGKTDRYWAYVESVQYEKPANGIPEYYRESTDNFHSWFKIVRFEKAANSILSQCFVISSGQPLSFVSRHSMSPYYMIEQR